MFLRFARRALGLGSDKALQRYQIIAENIIRSEGVRDLSATALRQAIQDLKYRVNHGARLDDVTENTFALVREASLRALGQSHTISQLVGGLAMHGRNIAEMPTGEGKTLAATLTCTLQALSGRSVHVASPNDYLSTRDAAWMRPVYETLGLSVGLITSDMDDQTRRHAYACDVTYGPASEFAFDYLRDNMKFSVADTVQRGHDFALVDESDAVLIDEAGMPLSLYGPLGDHSGFYRAIDLIVAKLEPRHYAIDERLRVQLTDAGYERVQEGLMQAGLLKRDSSLHVSESISLLHHVVQALRARTLLTRDRDYIVKHDSVVIVDPLSGRLMDGRRYDDGLHQALEAKEGCAIGEETRITASITFQSFFSKYDRLAGMTGTAVEDADEYRRVYGLNVVPVPPNRPSIRIDQSLGHPTQQRKLAAIVAQIEDAHAKARPVLIGAPTIAQSERIAAALQERGWKPALGTGDRRFAVLNAKHHASEAQIIAQAGSPGAVTIATAMAGRGTDIKLGGIPDNDAARQRVVNAGGLLVIGSEHHELARLDRQLRGRAGRQGDPGQTVFHASPQDDIVENAELDAAGKIDAKGIPDLQKTITAMQTRHSNRKFDDRCTVMRFDNAIEAQRATILTQRAIIRDAQDPLALAKDLRDETIDNLLAKFIPDRNTRDIAGLDASVRAILTLAVEFPGAADKSVTPKALRDTIIATADHWMGGKVSAHGRDKVGETVRTLMLALLDHLWTEQTERLEHLRRMIGDRRLSANRAVAEFETEAFTMLKFLTREFRHEVTAHAMRLGFSG